MGERTVDDAVIDKLVCDVHEIHARVCDAPLFDPAIWEPGHAPKLRPSRSWVSPLDQLLEDVYLGARLEATALDENRLELRVCVSGARSRPLIFALFA